MSVRRSAGGDGFSPLRLERGQDEPVDLRPRPAGVLDRRGARRPHRPERPPVARLAGRRAARRPERRSHPRAPRATAGRARSSASGGRPRPGRASPSGGIFSSPRCSTASMIRLSRGLPGTAAGPLSPPLSTSARPARLSPPRVLPAPWHFWHFSARIGRMDFSKNSVCAGVVRAGTGGLGR